MDLCGVWEFRKEGSDHFEGLREISGVPAIALFSHGMGEFIEISTSPDSLEEICLMMSSTHNPSTNMTRYFQLGKLSHHDFQGFSQPSAAAIVHCSDAFDEFSFLWMGPAAGQRTLSHLRLDQGGRGFRVDISIDVPGVPSVKLVKYFTAIETTNRPLRPVRTAPLELARYSRNWLMTNSEPNELSGVRVVASSCIELELTETGKTFMDTAHAAECGALQLEPLRRHKDKFKSGEVAQFFVLGVKFGDYEWNVLHRFREFESIHAFVEAQVGFNKLPALPGKSLFKMGGDSLEHRAKALGEIINTIARQSAFDSVNTSDALFAFLEIPEHSCDEFLSTSSAAYAYQLAMEGEGGPYSGMLPQDALHARLSPGFEVLKHSRSRFQQKPRPRLLRVDNGVTMLFWSELEADGSSELTSKSLRIKDITAVVKSDETTKLASNLRRKSITPSKLTLCFSIVTEERTLDLQCKTEQDFNFLYNNLSAVVEQQKLEEVTL